MKTPKICTTRRPLASACNNVQRSPVWTNFQSSDYALLLPDFLKLWGASETEAIGLGGHLVTINNAAENAWVLSTFGNFGGIQSPLWIGLNDEASEGNFVWSSGEAVTYLNWNGGEPNNGGNEDHGVMRGLDLSPGADTWNDVSSEVYFGVVEVPEPATASLLLIAAGGMLFRRSSRSSR